MKKQKSKTLTEEFLVEQLQLIQKNFSLQLQEQLKAQKDYFTEYLHEQLRAQSIFLEARVDAARQDFREHIGAAQKQFNNRMDGFEKKMDRFEKRMDGFYSELKTTQFAIRAVKDDMNSIEQKLTVVIHDHEQRLTQLEAAV